MYVCFVEKVSYQTREGTSTDQQLPPLSDTVILVVSGTTWVERGLDHPLPSTDGERGDWGEGTPTWGRTLRLSVDVLGELTGNSVWPVKV